MTPTTAASPTGKSFMISPSTSPSQKEVDAALKYIRSKSACKKIPSSPKSVVRDCEEKCDYRETTHYPSTSSQQIPSSVYISSHSTLESDTQWIPCFDLNESSPARVMTEWLRLSFTSQVSSKHIRRDISSLNTDSISMDEDS
jgi:hypothetical protein